MWPKIELELAALLKKKTYTSLVGAPRYDKILVRGLPDPKACDTAAKDIIANQNLRNGIKEFGSREPLKVEEWSKPLCRAISPRNSAEGPWWFDEALVQRWAGIYPPGTPNRKQKILDSLRPMLAVCIDWNDFTDLALFRPSAPIPAITGQGAHMPRYSDKDPQQRHLEPEEHKIVFIGGFKQVFLPFLKPGTTSVYPL
jgi:hypothetical protein